jgi:hypothetical protein
MHPMLVSSIFQFHMPLMLRTCLLVGLNSVRKKHMNGSLECVPGYSYDPARKSCIRNDGTSGTSSICLAGYNYDPARQCCSAVLDSGPPGAQPVSAVCPLGITMNIIFAFGKIFFPSNSCTGPLVTLNPPLKALQAVVSLKAAIPVVDGTPLNVHAFVPPARRLNAPQHHPALDLKQVWSASTTIPPSDPQSLSPSSEYAAPPSLLDPKVKGRLGGCFNHSM